jgi:hypothetical protein
MSDETQEKPIQDSTDSKPEKQEITLGTEWPNHLTVKNSKEEKKQHDRNKGN